MSNKVDFSKIPNKTLEEYNIIKFNSVDKIFDFLFDEEEYESRGFTGKMVFYKESLCYESKRRRAK